MNVLAGDPERWGPSGAAGPHVFVDDLERPVLTDDDRHHLARSLRRRDGDPITISDGHGSWRHAAFGPEIAVAGDLHAVPEPEPTVGVGFALVKGGRPELVTQKLTELGVDRIVPFLAERSVVRWDETKAERQLERLRIIAREASMQSRRVWLPTIEPLRSFDELAGEASVARADRVGDPPSLSHRLVLIGPEGGWTESEQVRVPSAMVVGTQVLRAETAAIATGTVLVALRGGLVAGPTDPCKTPWVVDSDTGGGLTSFKYKEKC